MATDEEIQKAFGQALVRTLKLTEIGQRYKGPELLFLISKRWSQLFADGILNLEQLHHDMAKTPDVDPLELLGFFLLFRDQEAALGIQMQLPSELILMPQLKRDKLYQNTKKMVESRLMAHMAAPPVAETPQQRAQKIVLSSKKSRLRLVLMAIVIVLTTASILVNIYSHTPPRPDTKAVTDVDLNAIGLTGTLSLKGNIYVLKVPPDEWKSLPRELQRTRLLTLAKLLEQRGLSNLIVIDTAIVTQAVVTPAAVYFIERRP
ncbi:MAG: hypothetical protein JXR83_18490 [Deltaproteobacteria bacterium]|nr:hypothetical protein [Deltaproteobacteria bacterium]